MSKGFYLDIDTLNIRQALFGFQYYWCHISDRPSLEVGTLAVSCQIGPVLVSVQFSVLVSERSPFDVGTLDAKRALFGC